MHVRCSTRSNCWVQQREQPVLRAGLQGPNNPTCRSGKTVHLMGAVVGGKANTVRFSSPSRA
jgi:hypothetical protein